jgi:hypothetical protein
MSGTHFFAAESWSQPQLEPRRDQVEDVFIKVARMILNKIEDGAAEWSRMVGHTLRQRTQSE